MKLQQLQSIIEVDKNKSISAAAKKLYMGQTTLSASIKKLEEELGFEIFKRKNDGVETTLEGRQVLDYAERICRSYSKVQKLGAEKQEQKSSTMYVSPGIESFLPGMLNEFLAAKMPDAQLVYTKAPTETIFKQIIDDNWDVVISHMGLENQEKFSKLKEKYDVGLEKLGCDKLYLVVPQDHPLAGLREIETSQIQNMDIAALSSYRYSVNSIVYEGHLGYSNRYTTFPSVRLMKRAVFEQKKVAIMSGSSIMYDNTAESGALHPILITDPVRNGEVSIWLMYRQSWALSPVGEMVITAVREIFANLNGKAQNE